MRSGELNDQIFIKRRSSVSDGAGGASLTWNTDADPVWAKIESQGGQFAIRSGRLDAPALYAVTVRMPFEMALTDRIFWKNKDFLLKDYAPPAARAVFMTFVMEEIQN